MQPSSYALPGASRMRISSSVRQARTNERPWQAGEGSISFISAFHAASQVARIVLPRQHLHGLSSVSGSLWAEPATSKPLRNWGRDDLQQRCQASPRSNEAQVAPAARPQRSPSQASEALLSWQASRGPAPSHTALPRLRFHLPWAQESHTVAKPDSSIA